MRLARPTGAIAILATGAIHLQQLLVEDFQGLLTIRALFVLNVIGSAAVGLLLLAPLGRVLSGMWPDVAAAVLAAVGLLIAAGSLLGLFLAETDSLFGLRSRHYSTAALVAIAVEGAAVLLLTPVLVGSCLALARPARSTSSEHG